VNAAVRGLCGFFGGGLLCGVTIIYGLHAAFSTASVPADLPLYVLLSPLDAALVALGAVLGGTFGVVRRGLLNGFLWGALLGVAFQVTCLAAREAASISHLLPFLGCGTEAAAWRAWLWVGMTVGLPWAPVIAGLVGAYIAAVGISKRDDPIRWPAWFESARHGTEAAPEVVPAPGPQGRGDEGAPAGCVGSAGM